MRTAIALALIVVGSVVFHFLSPWWWTPLASNWGYIDSTIIITFWITGAVFAAVVLFMAYCVYRFRHREGSRAAYEPENKRLESWLAIGTAVGVALMKGNRFACQQSVVPVVAEAEVAAGGMREAVCERLGNAQWRIR